MITQFLGTASRSFVMNLAEGYDESLTGMEVLEKQLGPYIKERKSV